jgi:hypothetical protein
MRVSIVLWRWHSAVCFLVTITKKFTWDPISKATRMVHCQKIITAFEWFLHPSPLINLKWNRKCTTN